MSSVWMALFLIGGAVMFGARRVEGLLVAAVLLGFAGVALVLRPSMDASQVWPALAGVLSGVLAALAYLQLTALGRVGEPEERTVFYFNVGSMVLGGLLALGQGLGRHSVRGLLLLLAIGVLAAFAQMLLTRAYTVGRPLANAVLQYLGIVFAFAYGLIFFDEGITGSSGAGVVLIIAAGLMSTRVRSRAPEPEDTRGRDPSAG